MATLRKRGVRTAVLCSEPFLKLAQAQAKTFHSFGVFQKDVSAGLAGVYDTSIYKAAAGK